MGGLHVVKAWLRWGDGLLARSERAGVPAWGVVALAYLIGYEIAEYLANR